MEDYYDVFHRTWWKENPAWPDGLEPCPGKRTYLAQHVTYADSQEIVAAYARTHSPGRLSRKAEIERA